jgi:hypothetical protein
MPYLLILLERCNSELPDVPTDEQPISEVQLA